MFRNSSASWAFSWTFILRNTPVLRICSLYHDARHLPMNPVNAEPNSRSGLDPKLHSAACQSHDPVQVQGLGSQYSMAMIICTAFNKGRACGHEALWHEQTTTINNKQHQPQPQPQQQQQQQQQPHRGVSLSWPPFCTRGSHLGTPVVPFYTFYFGVSLLKLNSRKKGTLIVMGLLGNLGTWRATRYYSADSARVDPVPGVLGFTRTSD